MNWPDFSCRSPSLEFMDQENCDEAALLRTLRQFRITNPLFSRYRTILTSWFLRDMQRDPAREYTWVDVGAGGGDIPVWLARAARKCSLRLRVIAIDRDRRTVDHLLRTLPDDVSIKIICDDIFAWLEGRRDIDYLYCNNFFHHLPDTTALEFLRLLDRSVRRRFVISDIERSAWAYVGYSAFAALFLHRSFAGRDGRLSILRGFTPGELRDCAGRSGISMSTGVQALAPARLVLWGER